MDVTVIANSELKALRQIAQTADCNGDFNKALSEFKKLNTLKKKINDLF